MKITILKLAAFAFLAVAFVLGLACSSARGPDARAAFTEAKPDSVLPANDETTIYQQFTLFEHANMALPANKTWVRKSVGLPPLNVFRRPFEQTRILDGHSEVLLRPKITSLIEANDRDSRRGFAGLAGDHFARADV